MTMQGMMASLQGWHQLVLSGVTKMEAPRNGKKKKKGV